MNFENFCYRIIDEDYRNHLTEKGVNYEGAKKSCLNNLAVLGSVHSEEERDFITDVLMADPLKARRPLLLGGKGIWMQVQLEYD